MGAGGDGSSEDIVCNVCKGKLQAWYGTIVVGIGQKFKFCVAEMAGDKSDACTFYRRYFLFKEEREECSG